MRLAMVVVLAGCVDGATVPDGDGLVMVVDCSDPDVLAALDDGGMYDTGLVSEPDQRPYGAWVWVDRDGQGGTPGAYEWLVYASVGPVMVRCHADSQPSYIYAM